MRRRDDVDQGGVTARRNSLEVAREHRFERLFALPFRISGCHCLDLIEGEEELKRKRTFRPQRPVVVEGGDALFRRDKVWTARLRDACNEVEDRFPRRTIVPRGQGVIGPVALRQWRPVLPFKHPGGQTADRAWIACQMSEAIARLGAAWLAFARRCGYLRSADWKYFKSPHPGRWRASPSILP
jgi:hypothetical protein